MAKYEEIITWIFNKNFKPGFVRVEFEREDFVKASTELGMQRIRNLGDIPYSFRFRQDLPGHIQATAPSGLEWIIIGTGIGKYEFRLAAPGKIDPNPNMQLIDMPDSTPEIVKYYASSRDEQALLTKIRYNRLVDTFSGLTCYSIQNHLRTTIQRIGQIEVDEIYVGLNKRGTHFILPCQAKSPGDKFGIVQVMQDISLCKIRYPHAICKPIALQFMDENSLAILELSVIEEDQILNFRIVEEKHYRLVPESKLSAEKLNSLMKSE